MQSTAPPSYFFKIHFTLFSYFHLDLASGISHSEFIQQNAICASPLPFTFYMPRPPNSSRFDHRNNIWRGVHTMKLHITRFSLVFCYLVPLRTKCLPQRPKITLNPYSSLNLRHQDEKHIQHHTNYIVVYFNLWGPRWHSG